MSQAKQVAINTLSGYFRLFVSFAVIFFLTPFIIGKIGKDGYGLWSLIFSILSFFELLDFGFASAVIKYVAETKAKKEFQRRNKIITTALFVYFILSLIGLLGVFILTLFIDSILTLSPTDKEMAIYLIAILSCRSLLINLPCSVFRGLLFGENKIYLTNYISLAGSLIFAFLAWIILSKGYGIMGLAIANFIAGVLENTAYIVFANYFVPNLKLHSLKEIDIPIFQTLFSFSSTQFLSNIYTMVIYNSDLIIIKMFLPLSSVGLYAIPLRIVTFGYIFLKQFTNVLTPVMVDMYTLDKRDELRNLIIRSTRYVLIPSTMITIGGIISAHYLLTLWVGQDFVAAEGALIILLISMWLGSTHLLSGDVLQYCGFNRLYAVYLLVNIFIHLSFAIVFASFLGINGVALGSFFGSLAGYFTDFRKVCSLYNIKYLEYANAVFTPLILPSIIQIGVLYMLMSLIPMNQILVLIIINLIGFIAFGVTLWNFILKKEEKNKIYNAVFKKL